MNFCNHCGQKVIQKTPVNDNRLRFVCETCDTIHYQNPNIVAGVLPIVIDENDIEKILLCRRAIEPRYGYWTLPAGFMENKENLEEAAKRESMEEANLKLSELKIYTITSLPYISQVYMLFIGIAENDFSPGIETLETKLFTEDEIPWELLAFPVIKTTLQHYFADRKQLLSSKSGSYKEANTLTADEMSCLPVHNSSLQRK